MPKKKKIKRIIIILSIQVILCSVLLIWLVMNHYFFKGKLSSVSVPDNVIESEENQMRPTEQPLKEETDAKDSKEMTTDSIERSERKILLHQTSQNGETQKATLPDISEEEKKNAKPLYFHTKHTEDNQAFHVQNMFPGDQEVSHYCVQISHKGPVILCFHTEIQPGYEILANVMKCRIELPESGEVLYDGLMKDMPDAIETPFYTKEKTISEAYYKIIAYLDTSVDNQYMNQDLAADFTWWIKETEPLCDVNTSDTDSLFLYGIILVGAFLTIICLNQRRKRVRVDG